LIFVRAGEFAAGFHPETADFAGAFLLPSLRDYSHLLAGMTTVAAAVVMTLDFGVVAFGFEISGQLPDPMRLARACDLEGRIRILESGEARRRHHRTGQ
jgi:hypothetical protein